MEESLTTEELVRLMDWLGAKGFSAEDILDCIRYIASGKSIENLYS